MRRRGVVGERLGVVEGDLDPVDVDALVAVLLITGRGESESRDVPVELGCRLNIRAGEEHSAELGFRGFGHARSLAAHSPLAQAVTACAQAAVIPAC